MLHLAFLYLFTQGCCDLVNETPRHSERSEESLSTMPLFLERFFACGVLRTIACWAAPHDVSAKRGVAQQHDNACSELTWCNMPATLQARASPQCASIHRPGAACKFPGAPQVA